jgi:hypothetical protein
LQRRGLRSSTDVLRKDFSAVAGQHFLPVADAFAADAIFDALTSRAAASTSAAGADGTKAGDASTPGISAKIGDFWDSKKRASASGASGDDRPTLLVPAAPLAAGVCLPLDAYKQYCAALHGKVCAENGAWEQLRAKLGLERCEVLVRCDDKVTAQAPPAAARKATAPSWARDAAAGPGTPAAPAAPAPSRFSWTDVGTVYLTDRHLVFCRKGRVTTIRGFETTSAARPLVRIVPLCSVLEVREVADGGLLLDHAAVLTARLDDQSATWASICALWRDSSPPLPSRNFLRACFWCCFNLPGGARHCPWVFEHVWRLVFAARR